MYYETPCILCFSTYSLYFLNKQKVYIEKKKTNEHGLVKGDEKKRHLCDLTKMQINQLEIEKKNILFFTLLIE